MESIWTSKEIEGILLQLEKLNLPFNRYCFSRIGKRIKQLGKGGFSRVYEAKHIYKKKKLYAIKVIGFEGSQIDRKAFNKSIEAQKMLQHETDGIVKIYDTFEACIYIGENNQIIKVQSVDDKEKNIERNYLYLQFVLMEKVQPVITKDSSGKMTLFPEQLNNFNKDEILKLAYDVGCALEKAHQKRILHRDIKLENIFYDERKKQYKLGDFGIARVTIDGVASTIAFTKGYGAPEIVGSFENNYDRTADVYSFGIVIYVLLNRLKFPDSKSYHVNIKEQYSENYRIPKLENAQGKLGQCIDKMCRFRPAERYQSMELVLNDLEKIIYNKTNGCQREQKKKTLWLGIFCGTFGIIFWELCMVRNGGETYSILDFLFWICCIWKMMLVIWNYRSRILNIVTILLGFLTVLESGLMWWNVTICLCSIISLDMVAGTISWIFLLAHIFRFLLTQKLEMIPDLQNKAWLAIVMISITYVFLLQYEILKVRGRKFVNRIIQYNIPLKVAILCYAIELLRGVMIKIVFAQYGTNLVSRRVLYYYEVLKVDPLKIGTMGLLICIFYIMLKKKSSVKFC